MAIFSVKIASGDVPKPNPNPEPAPKPKPGDPCPGCGGDGLNGDGRNSSKCLDCNGTGKVLATMNDLITAELQAVPETKCDCPDCNCKDCKCKDGKCDCPDCKKKTSVIKNSEKLKLVTEVKYYFSDTCPPCKAWEQKRLPEFENYKVKVVKLDHSKAKDIDQVPHFVVTYKNKTYNFSGDLSLEYMLDKLP